MGRGRRVSAWVLVVVCVVGALLCGTGWALSSPVGSTPDEQYHLGSIWCVEPSAVCETLGDNPAGKPIVRLPVMVGQPSCYAFHPELSGECQEAFTPGQTVDTDNINTSGDYPGGFYRVMSWFVGDDITASVLVMRLVNLLIAVVLFTVLALNATRVTRRLQMYALASLLIPFGWFLIPSVNPSGWAITAVVACGFALHSYFAVQRRRKLVVNGVLAVVAAIMAASARGDAAAYICIVAFCVCVLHWRALIARPLLGAVPLLCCLIGAPIALTAGQVSSTAGIAPEGDMSRANTLASIVMEFPALPAGIFGEYFGLGWLDTPVPHLTKVTMVAVAGFFVFAGLGGRGGRSKLVAVLLLGGALVAIPVLTLYRLRVGVGLNVQPRYLLPLMPVLLMLMMVGAKPRQGLLLARRQAWLVWGALVAAQAAALYTNFRRYVVGFDDPLVIDHEEWWWSSGPGPVTLWLVGSVGFAMFAWAVVLTTNEGLAARARARRRISAHDDRLGSPDLRRARPGQGE